MSSYLTHLVVAEQITDQRVAAERYHLAAAAANDSRRERAPRLPSLRANRSLLGLRRRLHLA